MCALRTIHPRTSQDGRTGVSTPARAVARPLLWLRCSKGRWIHGYSRHRVHRLIQSHRPVLQAVVTFIDLCNGKDVKDEAACRTKRQELRDILALLQRAKNVSDAARSATSLLEGLLGESLCKVDRFSCMILVL